MNLPVEFPHRLWLTSHPAEAEVWKGDKLLGLTPILLDQRLYSGSGFRLSHEGYADTLLSSRLIKNRSYLLAELHRKHPGSGSPTISSRVGTWLWRGAGAAVLLGTAGYICQKRADKAYSNYLRTGHQGRMNQEYDRAVHYDKLTGIFYVAGEISLGVTLYFAVEKIW